MRLTSCSWVLGHLSLVNYTRFDEQFSLITIELPGKFSESTELVVVVASCQNKVPKQANTMVWDYYWSDI
jgi:hypothetical protein